MLHFEEVKLSDTNQKRSARTLAWLRHIGEARDGILILGGALYLLGYLVVSLNAWRNGLGLLPILEAQYLVAGLPAAIILSLIYFITVQNLRFVDALRKWLKEHSGKTGWQNVPRIFFKTVQYTSAISFAGLLLLMLRGKKAPPTLIHVAYLIAIYIMLLTYAASDKEEGSGLLAWVNRKYNQLMVVVFPVTFGVFLLGLYMLLFYPSLPQSFGGAKPRCAFLDLARDEISPKTLASVLPAENLPATVQPSPAPSPNEGAASSSGQGKVGESEINIVRSDRVEILFSGGDYTLIRIARLEGNQPQEVYEIKKDAIHAVKPCK
jgi:hypothetical protein